MKTLYIGAYVVVVLLTAWLCLGGPYWVLFINAALMGAIAPVSLPKRTPEHISPQEQTEWQRCLAAAHAELDDIDRSFGLLPEAPATILRAERTLTAVEATRFADEFNRSSARAVRRWRDDETPDYVPRRRGTTSVGPD